MKDILKKIYYNIFSSYEKELEKAIGNSQTVLELGCGDNSPLQFFTDKFYSTGVDLFEKSIEISKNKNIHNDYIKADVLEIEQYVAANSYNTVIALDLIEHLEKNEGYKLIQIMKKLAKNKVIIFTPNGFMPQGDLNENPWQVHRSGWETSDFEKEGFKVTGINGHKSLRGDLAVIKYKPLYFWTLISDISQFFVKKNPINAFHLLAVYEK